MWQDIKEFFKKVLNRILRKKTEEVAEHTGFSGWVPDVFDERDRVYAFTTVAAQRPAMVDLRARFRTAIENQGSSNTCVGHAVTSMAEAIFMSTVDRSRLFVYWNSRSYEGTTTMDAGTQIRNAMRSISAYGIAEESKWAFSSSAINTKPSSAAYSNGLPFKSSIASYVRITSLDMLKDSLVAGRPVAFGFSVTQKFVSETNTTGILPYPVTGEKILGGHAVVAVGYDDAAGMVICRNSYGSTWGKGGYFMMPYQWFSNMNGYVADAWTFVPKV